MEFIILLSSTLSDDYYNHNIIGTKAFEIVIEDKTEELSMNSVLAQKTHSPKDIPVPQADDLNRVIDLLNFLSDGPANKSEIAENYEFDERQSDYYGNAARYIGLVEKDKTSFKLTESGKKIISIVNRKKRNLYLIKALLSTKLFNDLTKLYLSQSNRISDDQIIERLREEEKMSGTTPERRKSTM